VNFVAWRPDWGKRAETTELKGRIGDFMTAYRSYISASLCAFKASAQSALAERPRADRWSNRQSQAEFQFKTHAAEKAAPHSGGAPSGNASAPATGSAPSASSPSHHQFARELRHLSRDARRITVEERKKVIEVVRHDDLPSIDVEVFFAYDSSSILPEALPKLITLGQALSDPELRGSSFLIAGHTDARGSDYYNLALSNARAEAVKRFLVSNFHLEPESLITLSFGEEQLNP
jgi:outer membrane protein OmpA-like peptidoglycan-associated protein